MMIIIIHYITYNIADVSPLPPGQSRVLIRPLATDDKEKDEGWSINYSCAFGYNNLMKLSDG